MKKKYIVMLGGVLLLAGAGLGLLFGSIDMNQISRMLEDIPHGLREILMIVLIASQIFLAFFYWLVQRSFQHHDQLLSHSKYQFGLQIHDRLSSS